MLGEHPQEVVVVDPPVYFLVSECLRSTHWYISTFRYNLASLGSSLKYGGTQQSPYSRRYAFSLLNVSFHRCSLRSSRVSQSNPSSSSRPRCSCVGLVPCYIHRFPTHVPRRVSFAYRCGTLQSPSCGTLQSTRARTCSSKVLFFEHVFFFEGASSRTTTGSCFRRRRFSCLVRPGMLPSLHFSVYRPPAPACHGTV
jgi:hypothetical protein